MSTKEKAADAEAPAKGGKKKLLLIVLVLLLAAGGAALLLPVLGLGEGRRKPVSSGTFLTLDPVAVNLAGGGYLKIGVAMELTEEGAAAATAARAWTVPRRRTSSSRRSPRLHPPT